MDQAIRNRLRTVVTQCRRLLEEAVSQVLQGQFGIFATGKKGEVQVEDAGRMGHLSDEDRGYREQTLVHFEHLQARGGKPADALEQLIREVAFTHLNRLCAYKMMEKRGLIREAVSRGLKSQGFLFYLSDNPEDERRAAGGEQDLAYKHYLQWLGGTLSEEIGVLFAPSDPANRLFPPQRVLDEVLGLLNGDDLKDIWSEDETIGWVYQYFTPKELREQVRKESQAPRNSYELAFRNQFFTPRYVVEFLTDNTLGRLWYEMRKGETRLKDECRYLVRRPTEVFLRWEFGDLDRLPTFVGAALRGDFSELPETPAWDEINPFALLIDGYGESERHGLGDCGEFANARLEEYRSTGQWRGNALELWCCLFFEQRRWRHFGYAPEGDDFAAILSLYRALRRELTGAPGDLSQDELLKRPVFVPLRLPKDPRQIKVLDPACGSGHFLLYAFALLLVIYEEAWEHGLIDRAEFGVRTEPGVRPEAVRLKPEVRPTSNYSGETLDPDRAFVVVTETPDGGDGVEANTPYLVDGATTFRVPFRFRVPLKQFDYAQALRENWFTPEAGRQFVGQIGCFEFEGVPVRSEEDAYQSFRRQVPALILRHNLHGIDIDPRAVQIAALALWLRAQRAYQDIGLKRGDRPRITRTNVVCAEPMPGEEALLNDFLRTLRNDRLESLMRRVLKVPEGTRVRATQAMVDSLGDLVRSVWRNMKLAGEVGSLLKVEEDLQGAIASAQDEWEEKLPLFRMTRYERDQSVKESYVRLVPGEQDTFWGKAEGLVLAALADYARQAGNGHGLIRRLFAEDAASGFAFIDLYRQRFDVVLMNPPFGEASKFSKSYIEKAFPRTKNDIYAAFVERGLDLLQRGGHLGAITSRTGFFLTSFQKWREEILLDEARPTIMADLGYGVLDAAMVETAAYCLEKDLRSGSTIFLRLLSHGEKEEGLTETIESVVREGRCIDRVTFVLESPSFRQVPGSPFAYWVSERIRRLFVTMPSFESQARNVRLGDHPSDDFRFLRLAWEIPTCYSRLDWRPYVKGGEYSPYYYDVHLRVDWDAERQTYRNFFGRPGRSSERPSNHQYFFLPGLTWPRRSTSGFGIRVLPSGCVFSDKAPSIFQSDDSKLATLGILFSQTYQKLIEISLAAGEETQSGTASRSYEVGLIQRLPWAYLSKEEVSYFENEVSAIVKGVRLRDTRDETATWFISPIANPSMSLEQSAMDWQRTLESYYCQLIEHAANIETKVADTLKLTFFDSGELTTGDARVLRVLPERVLGSEFDEVYRRSIHETIRQELDEGGGNRQIAVKSYYVSRHLEVLSQTLRASPRQIAQVASERKLLPEGLLHGVAESLISFCIGCVFGRWDMRLSTGDRQPPELPDPFAPLPVCSPCMLQGPDRLPLSEPPEGYPLRIDRDGILVDDPDHPDDIVRRVRDVLELLWKDRAEAVEREACGILGVGDLRDYVRKPGNGGLWTDHVSRYSKSRRKAPIYWLLQSSKKNYALWVYYHKLDKDILFKALLNYVEPKIRLEESRLEPLRAQRGEAGTSGKAAKGLEKLIDKQEALLSELRDFEAKLRRAADLHLEPDLDDGVVLNIAPLWELVPWIEAKAYRDELLAGKYEWSSIGKLLRERGLVL